MKKNIFMFFLKIVVAVASAILTVLGASSLTSCAVKHYIDVRGRGTVVTCDTTIINHNGFLNSK